MDPSFDAGSDISRNLCILVRDFVSLIEVNSIPYMNKATHTHIIDILAHCRGYVPPFKQLGILYADTNMKSCVLT